MEEANAMADREFNTDEPIAYFITWTTYGTWLSGDQRGSWHRGQYPSPTELFRQMAAAEMKETAFMLSPEDRDIVEETVITHCEIRAWKLHYRPRPLESCSRRGHRAGLQASDRS